MSKQPSDMLEQDMQKVQRMRANDGERSKPALIEATLAGLTGVVGLVWVISLFWVGEFYDGTTWMAIGMFALTLTGVPAAIVYGLRRGGIELIRTIVQSKLR